MDKMIVYEDKNIMVIHKPAGIATQTGRLGQADLVSELKNYRKKKVKTPTLVLFIGLISPSKDFWCLQKMQRVQKY